MKILLKIVGVLVVVGAVAAAAGVGYLYATYPDVPLTEYRIEATPERLARGKYLNDHVVGCTTCHTQRDWTKFSGPVKAEALGAGGEGFNPGPAGKFFFPEKTPAGPWA